jgi:hypothetical protein
LLTAVTVSLSTAWFTSSSLAAPVSWVDASSFWDLTANWSTGLLPAAADDVTIDAAGARTVTVRSLGGPFSVNSVIVSGDDTLAIASGSLTINGLPSADNPSGASTLARFTQSGGSLGGAGAVTITGQASLGNGLHTGAATTVLKGASTLSGLHLDAGRILRNEGTATVTGGLNLNSTAAAGSGRIDNVAGALIDVRTFNLAIAATSHPGDASAAFIDNSGIFRKSTGNTYQINVPFFNRAGGTIDVQAGNFAFNAGGSYSGAATLAAGRTLGFGAGTHTVNAGASFTGEGTLGLSGASTVLAIAAPTTVNSRFAMSGGTVQGENLTLAGPVSIGIASSLGVMSGPATTLLQGASSVGGGANNPFGLDAGRVLRNEGSMTITGVLNLNRLDAPGAGRIENAANAVIDVRTFNQSIVATSFAGDTGADARVDNAGIFRKSTAGGYGINVPFNNAGSGVVDIQAGSFAFNAGGSHSGAVTLANATSLTLGGGNHDVHAGASFTGPGTLTLALTPTVLNLVAPATVDSAFAMSGGTIKGADLTLTGPVAIGISSSLGVMSGPATTLLQGASSVGGGVNNPFGLDSGRVLRNEGAMTINGVLDLNRLDATGSGRIVNAVGAVIDVQTFNQSIFARDRSATNPLDNGADARIDNAGIFRKSTIRSYAVAVHFNNTGTVEVLKGELVFTSFSNAGTVRVSEGASFQVTAPTFVNGGRIEGAGQVIAPGIVNAGSIAPGNSPGLLTIDSDLQLDPTSVLEIEIGGISAGDFDVLAVKGDASLGGELSVTRLAGYTPALGDSFIVMTMDGVRSGEFATRTFHDFGGARFSVLYNEHDVTLGVIAVPEPETWVMLLAGLGLVLAAVKKGPGSLSRESARRRPETE